MNTDKERADFASETDGDFLERIGLDAAKWAHEFRTIAKRLGYSEMDEGWLIGWFANAIERGRDAGREAERAEAVAMPEPVYKAVERILDENSAWISRPNDQVTRSIALAAVIAAYTALESECPEDAEPFAWWAETGTSGAGDDCSKLFFMRELAVDHVRKHGGDVVTVYRDPPKPDPSPDLVERAREILHGVDEGSGWYKTSLASRVATFAQEHAAAEKARADKAEKARDENQMWGEEANEVIHALRTKLDKAEKALARKGGGDESPA